MIEEIPVEDLKRSVAEVKNIEMTMMSALTRMEEKDEAINRNLEKLSAMEISISNSLSKFILIGSILIGAMMVGWGLFSAWSVYIVSQNNETQKTIVENRSSSLKRDSEMDIKLTELQKEQKAIGDAVAENNYAIHAHEDDQQNINSTLLGHIDAIVVKSKEYLEAIAKSKHLDADQDNEMEGAEHKRAVTRSTK